MTIDEIEATLPNGLHDASLERMCVDYVRREIKLELLACVEPPVSSGVIKEAMRKGILTVSGLHSCVVEAPTVWSSDKVTEGLWIADSGPLAAGVLLSKLPGPLPHNAFAHYFFINDWNAFIIIVGVSAHFVWASEV
jgi:hypothetical protein